VTNHLDSAPAAYAGKRVLITGAAGFIGAGLVDRLVAAKPRSLVLLDNSEQNLHELDLSLQRRRFAPYAAILGDVCDAQLLEEIFALHRPQIVLHAAACKHVPLMEQNPLAALRTNAIGTWRLLQAASRAGVEQLLLISTDKAVNPASIMGASKRVAELTLQRASGAQITLQTVRLGNVLGSYGSVSPLFAKQIALGGPVTVTHPAAERYFFSLADTVEIILCTSTQGSGTFIPTLPAPLKISQLAARMIRAAREETDPHVAVTFVGMRPGDKLREDFLHADEHAEALDSLEEYRVLRVHGPGLDARQFDPAFRRLHEAVERRQLPAAMDALRDLVPAYHPSDALLAMLREVAREGSLAKT
jgi:FlaA1/EpsC-like NDP-sugar epimerase